MTDTPQIYKALALQTECKAVNRCASREESRIIMMRSIARIKGQIMSALAFHGPDLKLVCMPEYFLTGFPARESELRYRRLVSMYAPSPYDVWDEYLKHYSEDEIFPVLETPLGRLAALASEEIRYPEISRILAAKGAEVILHPSSEAASTLMSSKNVAKIARAQENQCYVISANSAGITGTSLAPYSTDTRSQIVDDRGIILAETPSGENEYAKLDMHPSGTLGDGSNPPKKDFYRKRQDKVIFKLSKINII